MDSQDLFIIEEYIREFLASKQRKLMFQGQQYYDNEPEDTEMPHAFMYNLVDEKVQYLLGQEVTISCDDEQYLEEVKNVLGDNYLYKLQLLTTEAANKGIAWSQVYFNEEGRMKFFLHKSEQICPVWVDDSHTALKWVVRIYEIEEYKGTHKEKITKVEVYDHQATYFYILENGKLILDSEKYLSLPDSQEFGHFTMDGVQYSFGKVPFVYCKNNNREMPDLKYVKELIDAYACNRKRLDDLLEDFKNFFVVLVGYAGNPENTKTLEDMLKRRMIEIESDGSVEFKTPTIDTTANESHNNTLKDDINLYGRSVDRNKMLGGNAPSGVALKTLYSGLDLKCNKLEVELKNYFKNLMYFINEYLKLLRKNVTDNPITLECNRDITMNETDIVNNCKNSVGVVSSRSIIERHPYAKSLEEELERIKQDEAINPEKYAKLLKELADNHDKEE